jgi:hypothetical protein
VEQRTALINRIRGLLSELGFVLPLKAATVRRQAHKHLEDLPVKPERLLSLRRVATIESIGPFTRVKGSKLFSQAVELHTRKQLGWLVRHFGQMQAEGFSS